MNEQEESAASSVFMALTTLSAGVLSFMAWTGRAYYLLPAAERPLSELHASLRPSGSLGLTYGIAGLALIIINLGYLVRRPLVRLEWLGSLRAWMSMHVFTGIISAVLILLHSAFMLRNPIAALASVSLLVVVFSGIAGRYIYTRVPRSPQGRELERGELEKAIKELHQALSGQGMEIEEGREGPADLSRQGVVSALAAMVRSDREEELEFENLRRAVLASPRMAASAAGILPLARRFVKEKRWLARYQELRELMRVWRLFHRWFSIVLIVFALFHILVATSLGAPFP